MKQKLLKCVRANGEELVIPKSDPLDVAMSFKFSTAREGKVAYKLNDAKEVEKVPYVEEVRENKSAHVVTDEMPLTRCHACRGWHTSKSKMRQCYREHKKLEVGDASMDELRVKEDPADKKAYEEKLRDDIAWAFNAVKYDEAPLDELTKERCKIINKQVEESGDNRLRSHDGSTLLDGRDK